MPATGYRLAHGKCWEECSPLKGPPCLRQHYLDQVLGSPAFRAELSAFVVLALRTAGWLPVIITQRLGWMRHTVKPVAFLNELTSPTHGW